MTKLSYIGIRRPKMAIYSYFVADMLQYSTVAIKTNKCKLILQRKLSKGGDWSLFDAGYNLFHGEEAARWEIGKHALSGDVSPRANFKEAVNMSRFRVG